MISKGKLINLAGQIDDIDISLVLKSILERLPDDKEESGDDPFLPDWENQFEKKLLDFEKEEMNATPDEVKDFIRNEFKLIAKEIEVLANNTKNRAFDDDVIEVMRTRGVEV